MVTEIIIRVIAEYGYLDIDACIVWLAAERDRRRWPRLRLVDSPWAGMRETCPTGAA